MDLLLLKLFYPNGCYQYSVPNVHVKATRVGDMPKHYLWFCDRALTHHTIMWWLIETAITIAVEYCTSVLEAREDTLELILGTPM